LKVLTASAPVTLVTPLGPDVTPTFNLGVKRYRAGAYVEAEAIFTGLCAAKRARREQLTRSCCRSIPHPIRICPLHCWRWEMRPVWSEQPNTRAGVTRTYRKHTTSSALRLGACTCEMRSRTSRSATVSMYRTAPSGDPLTRCRRHRPLSPCRSPRHPVKSHERPSTIGRYRAGNFSDGSCLQGTGKVSVPNKP
jgi:hypothetical protein